MGCGGQTHPSGNENKKGRKEGAKATPPRNLQTSIQLGESQGLKYIVPSTRRSSQARREGSRLERRWVSSNYLAGAHDSSHTTESFSETFLSSLIIGKGTASSYSPICSIGQITAFDIHHAADQVLTSHPIINKWSPSAI